MLRETQDKSTPFWKDPDAIASHMEDVVWGMAEAVNLRLFEAHSSSQYFAPDFVVELGRGPARTGLATHYDDVRKRVDEQPGQVIVSVSNCSSSVDLKTGYACLTCHMEANDPCDGLRRQQAAVFVWRLFDTKWLCVKYTAIRNVF
ncbi:hypothetical protein PRZ48_008122 [Zasmidium cellare]|uniref:SnoaL-like domain-containing protein n=1 Tax=Zasmidium cellare TaxID=395010 RepID=A0ABR0EEL3_ZASCE|nr:hypothetical protein PRZ48_008122 [Zasmidium cellare]